jgi:hypothetical protein
VNYGDTFAQRLKVNRVAPKLGSEWRKLIAPIVAPRTRLRNETFVLWDDTYRYFIHPHNSTWRNERAVEIPVARKFVDEGTGALMEFGNVLSWYDDQVDHHVVDKYERRPGVTNIDIVDYEAPQPFDRVLSISTIEHVGWDERPRDPAKLFKAFDQLLACLKPGGKLLLTAPLGHNPTLDKVALTGRWHPTREATLIRTDVRRNRWEQSDEVETRAYLGRGRGANATWFAEFVKPAGSL